jgi:hypothetical protein
VVTAAEEELGGRPDGDVARRCQEEQRALVTLDLDFSSIRSYPPEDYAGIIVLRVGSVLASIPKPGDFLSQQGVCREETMVNAIPRHRKLATVFVAVGIGLLAGLCGAPVEGSSAHYIWMSLNTVNPASLSLLGQSSLTGNTVVNCLARSTALSDGESVAVTITYPDAYGATQTTSKTFALIDSANWVESWFTYTTKQGGSTSSCSIKVRVTYGNPCSLQPTWVIQFQGSCQ